ncbi:MAG TPA: tetratricopeptide repeat protein [Stellaceae bacterium]|nr:tetratricopeptide repeat protein [Stellaceae bacterium]
MPPSPAAGSLAEIEAALRRAIQQRPRDAAAHFRLGMVQHQQGRLAEAERCYRAALRLGPDNGDALNNLSLVLEQRGQLPEAEALLRRALGLQPQNGRLLCNLARLMLGQGRLDDAAASFARAADLPDVAAAAQYGLATVRQRQQRPAEAEAHYRAALAREPRFVDALNDLGILLRHAGRDAEAEESFRRAVRLRPDFAPAHLNLGALLLDRERLDEAAAAFEQAHRLQPDAADAHYYLGAVARERYQHDAAEAAFSRAVALDPRHASALSMLGVMRQEAGKLGEAEQMFRRAIAADPAYVEVRINLGAVLSRQRRGTEALALAEETLALAPQSADAVNNRGTLWEIDADFEQALAWYERAVALDPRHPDANFNRGRLLLHLERWAEGWEGYEWRLKNKRQKRTFFRSVMWDGSPLDGKTLVLHAEQGLGDTLQFSRYAPLMAERGGAVVLAVQPPLRRLLGNLPGVASCHEVGGAVPAFDFLMPLASLPRLYQTTRATIPATQGYVRAPEDAVARWRERIAPADAGRRIGLAWGGNPEQSNDRNRSATLRALLPLLDVPGARFYNLQVGPRVAEIAECGVRDRLVDLSPHLIDFVETAAAMTVLDLVITVDTSVAHLAGALGRPCWVALTFLPDWRYHRSGADNPWYASQRLFRQPRRGDWATVVAEIEAALRDLAARPVPL